MSDRDSLQRNFHDFSVGDKVPLPSLPPLLVAFLMSNKTAAQLRRRMQFVSQVHSLPPF